MTDKELIVKLNSLKEISPDSNWLRNNRELLLSQISNSGARELSAWSVFIINFSSLIKAVSKPAYALGAFILILLTGSLFSHQAFSGAKPNDSLYIARIISEKAKLNTMFNAEERNKLAVQFATEHAQDISAVLADPQFNNDQNKDQVAKLNESFDQEINAVKTHISYLNPRAAKIDKNVDINDTVSMANSLKDNSGVQVFEDNSKANLGKESSVLTPGAKATSVLNTPNILLATSTASTTNLTVKEVSTDSVLDEVKQLFEKKDYTKASDKLKEVDEMIKN